MSALSPDNITETRQEKERAALRALPAQRTETWLMPIGTPHEIYQNGMLFTIIGREKRRLITADDISIHGTYLRSCEGDFCEVVRVEIRAHGRLRSDAA